MIIYIYDIYVYTHPLYLDFLFLPVCGAKKNLIIFMVILYMHDLAYGLKLFLEIDIPG